MKKFTLYLSIASSFLFSSPFSIAQNNIISWQKTFGGTSYEGFYSFKDVIDGGYIGCGFAWSNDGDVNGHHGSNGWASDGWVVRLNANGDTLWTKSLGGTYDDYAYDLVQTPDSGFIICLTSQSNDGNVSSPKGSDDYWIVKLNKAGAIEWEKSYGGTGSDEAYSIVRSPDGNYVVAGFSKSPDGDVTGHIGSSFVPNAWIIKIDGLGNLLWEKSINDGGLSSDYLYIYSVRNAPDTSYVIAGYYWANNPDYYMAKLDKSGNVLWQKTYGGSYNDYGSYAESTSDGGYILSGTSNSIDSGITDHKGYYDYWVVKTDSAGTKEWAKSYGGTDYDANYTVTQSSDGGYIIAGSSRSKDGEVASTHAGEDGWIVKTDNSGIIQWSEALGGDSLDNIFYAGQLSDGRYAFAGLTKSFNGDLSTNKGKNDGWLGILNCNPQVTPNVCIVTVDSLTKKNLIVWEKNGLPAYAASFNIYKESVSAGIYNLIGNKFVDSLSEFVDLNSNPAVKSNRYRIAIVDTCGNESPVSVSHKTMLLQVNKGNSGERNLIWENYEGFTFGSYLILRGTSPSTITILDTVANFNTQFSDWDTLTSVDSLFYIVAVLHPTGCTSTQKLKTYNSSKSNTAALSVNSSIGFSKPSGDFTVTPNPASGILSVRIGEMEKTPSNLWFEMSDVLGKTILLEKINNKNLLLNISETSRGVYHYTIRTSSEVKHSGRIVVE